MGVGVDQALKRKQQLVPLLLSKQLSFADDNVMERFPRPITFARDFGALLITENRLENRDDPERIEHHFARVVFVRRDAEHAVLSQTM